MRLSIKVRFLNFFRKLFQIPVFEAWLASRTRGRSPHALISKLVPNPCQYRRPSDRTFDFHGVKLTTDISDYLGHYYYFGFRDTSHEALSEICQPSFTVLDVGSNIGVTALRLARRSAQGKVFGFEPDPVNYSHCLKNLQLNNLDNLQVFNIGLGHEAGNAALELRTPLNRGGNRISQDAVNAVEVKIKKMDDVIRELELMRIDLIKIDVEGYELKVLQGAKRTLTASKPLLFIELDDRNLSDQGDSAISLVRFLKQCGYDQMVRADTFQPVDETTNFSDCHYDIIVR